ncbi:hypothetical protein SC206_12590 [Rouxiella sp. T17]|uniref:hypothetical protein n=1 Tax=Rouxiella sp. T17 TaxID=3085684 RepID=UPI002FC75EBC
MIILEFLTKDENEIVLAKRYWSRDEKGKFRERVDKILPYKNMITVHQFLPFLSKLARAYDPNQTCPRCGGAFPVHCRTATSAYPCISIIKCISCIQNLSEKHKKDEVRAKAQIANKDKVNRAASINYNLLPDDAAIILLSIMRAINDEKLYKNFRIDDCHTVVNYSQAKFIAILIEHQAVIEESSKSKLKPLYLNDGEFLHYSHNVVYSLVPHSGSKFPEDPFFLLENRVYKNSSLIKDLWVEYALSECMYFLVNKCNALKLTWPTDISDILFNALHLAIHKYSISQVWTLIEQAVHDTLSMLEKDDAHIDKETLLPKIIQSYLRQAVDEKRVVNNSARPKNHPLETLGEVFYEKFSLDENTAGINFSNIIEEKISGHITAHDFQDAGILTKKLFCSMVMNGNGPEILHSFAKNIEKGIGFEKALCRVISDYSVEKYFCEKNTQLGMFE